MSTRGRRYLFWCANEHHDFRIPEFEAIFRLLCIEPTWIERNVEEPWVILELSGGEEESRRILTRSVSTKYCVELWGDGRTYDELHETIRKFPDELKEPYFKEELSFKIYVESFKNKLSMDDRLARIESFDYLPIKGPVRMKDPDVVFSNFEYWGQDANRRPTHPLRLFFGRCVGEGRRELIPKHSIKTRNFIGNTTMDPTLSLLMANLTLVKNGDLVLDPFVGTGSLLVAAAEFGGYVLGGDIDYLTIHGRSRPSRVGQKKRAVGENVASNFAQYGLAARYLDVAVCDSSRPPWRFNGLDAIVTDPPYGIREPTTRVGTTKEEVVITEEQLPHHIPQKVEYGIREIYVDLLTFAATHLTVGGRLAFWVPVSRESYDEAKMPRHPHLRTVANCEQVFSSHTSRRLLVMEKVLSPISESQQEPGAEAEGVFESASEFRDQFFVSAAGVDRQERKRRVKKFGHLNLAGKEGHE